MLSPTLTMLCFCLKLTKTLTTAQTHTGFGRHWKRTTSCIKKKSMSQCINLIGLWQSNSNCCLVWPVCFASRCSITGTMPSRQSLTSTPWVHVCVTDTGREINQQASGLSSKPANSSKLSSSFFLPFLFFFHFLTDLQYPCQRTPPTYTHTHTLSYTHKPSNAT